MNNAMNIIRSCEVADSLWGEVDSMKHSLDHLIAESLGDFEFSHYKPAGPSVESNQLTDIGWMNCGTANSFPLMLKSKRKENPSAWLSYQISLFGDGVSQIDDNENGPIPYAPTLHISFWTVPLNFEDGQYILFPFENMMEWEIHDDRLLHWDHSNIENEATIDQWTFSLRLLDMDSEDRLRKSAIAPIQALLAGTQAKQALPDDLKGLIRYKRKDHVNGEKTAVVKLESEIV